MLIETYVLPLHWTSYLFYGDHSDLTDGEVREIEDFCEGLGPCVNISDEDEFSWNNDANSVGGAVAVFHFQVLEKE